MNLHFHGATYNLLTILALFLFVDFFYAPPPAQNDDIPWILYLPTILFTLYSLHFYVFNYHI